jgi:hypothetical protein
MRKIEVFCALLLGLLLSSCASTAPVDLENAVRVFNVYQAGGEALPRKVEDCEFIGSASASAPMTDASSGSISFTDPKALLETIRSRAYRKGADTAFVSFDPKGLQLQDPTLRATIFRCGESTAPQKLGFLVR